MTTETYNGWTNRDTWLVPLWIDNDYGTYQAKMEALATITEPIDGVTARSIASGLEAEQLIAQDGGNMGNVNWEEIAEHWEDERLEAIEYAS